MSIPSKRSIQEEDEEEEIDRIAGLLQRGVISAKRLQAICNRFPDEPEISLEDASSIE
jgi:hypothetical protein